eukprot:6163845-Karenia_brevis.AAC.1
MTMMHPSTKVVDQLQCGNSSASVRRSHFKELSKTIDSSSVLCGNFRAIPPITFGRDAARCDQLQRGHVATESR